MPYLFKLLSLTLFRIVCSYLKAPALLQAQLIHICTAATAITTTDKTVLLLAIACRFQVAWVGCIVDSSNLPFISVSLVSRQHQSANRIINAKYIFADTLR